jgi:hypothetical protein
MAISLEELRRQRAQIQQHLDWLDAKIAAEQANVACPLAGRPEQPLRQTEPDTASSVYPEAENSADTGHFDDSTQVTADTLKVQNEPTHHDSETPQVSAQTGEPDSENEIPQFKAKTSEDLKRAKIGCVVLFVGATALFLFLLFGLPYLL